MIKPDHSEAGSAPLSPRESVSDRAHDTSNPNGGEESPAPEDPLENWNHPYQWPDDEEPHEEPRLPGLPSPTRRHRGREEAPQPAQEEPSGSKKQKPRSAGEDAERAPGWPEELGKSRLRRR